VVSGECTFKSKGILAIQFDEIVDAKERRCPIRATQSPRRKYASNSEHSSRRAIAVDKEGNVKAEPELTGGLKATSDVTKVATMIPLPGTLLFTSLTPAVAMGAVKAASPSVAYDKPIDEDRKNRRMKGATYGKR
jgi:hypothetical protein